MEEYESLLPLLSPDSLTFDLDHVMESGWCGQVMESDMTQEIYLSDLPEPVYESLGSLGSPQAVCGDSVPVPVPDDPASECDLPSSLLLEAAKFLQDNFPDLPEIASPGLQDHPSQPTQDHPSQPPQDHPSPTPQDYPSHTPQAASSATVTQAPAHNTEGCHTAYLPQWLPQGVPSASSVKSGSRAFYFVPQDALLETHGIPAPSRLPLLTPDGDGTVPLKNKSVGHQVTVPDRASSACIPYGTVTVDQVTVPDSAISASMCHSATYGTVSLDCQLIGVPDNTMTNPSHGTQITVPDECHNQGTASKRRRRRRREDGETGREKVRKYQQEPLSDQQEERKRIDAIRAKKCRERNRQQLETLREEVALLQREKEERDKEISARQHYEERLCELILHKTGLRVMPFGGKGDEMNQPLISSR